MTAADGRCKLLTPREAAARFGVTVSTLSRWANAGRIASMRTPGGTRRYRASEVAALLDAGTQHRVEVPS